jgi:hypothetical protein
MYHSQRQFVFINIAAGCFTHFAFVADYVEQVIGNLKRDTDIQAETGE